MTIRPLHNENDILNKIASGDMRAFTCLFDAHYKHLGQYVFRLTESKEVAEEIVQDVFVKIWARREELVFVDSFINYLFIITRNSAYRFLKEKATAHIKQQEWEKQYKEEHYLPDHVSPEEDFCRMIDQLVEKLPAQQKKVYELSRVANLKHVEIAQMLNISPETVKKHIMAASKFIKKGISEKKDLVFLFFITVLAHVFK